jgi:hypothetical protein
LRRAIRLAYSENMSNAQAEWDTLCHASSRVVVVSSIAL